MPRSKPRSSKKPVEPQDGSRPPRDLARALDRKARRPLFAILASARAEADPALPLMLFNVDFAVLHAVKTQLQRWNSTVYSTKGLEGVMSKDYRMNAGSFAQFLLRVQGQLHSGVDPCLFAFSSEFAADYLDEDGHVVAGAIADLTELCDRPHPHP